MPRKAQGIRPSQFVTSYGPGAILEGVDGARIIHCLDDSGIFQGASVSDFEVFEPALSQVLGNGARLFRLPTNAELYKPDHEPIYETSAFPKWSLCVEHHTLYRHSYDSRKACPDCPAHPDAYAAYQRSRLEAISLVLACPDGHLTDVDWSGLVHRDTPCGQTQTFLWKGPGGSLSHVSIHCPKCQAQANLGQAYLREHPCPGRWAERSGGAESCKAKARIVQRGASNLFVTDVLSSISVPRTQSDLTAALAHASLINLARMVDGETLQKNLANFNLPAAVRQTVEQASLAELEQARKQLDEFTGDKSPEQARSIEFRELKKATALGASHQSKTAAAWVAGQFEVDPSLAISVSLGPFRLKVTPILRLRVVTAQRGYRRLGGKRVPSCYLHGATEWYPATELLGEGIFLEFAEPPPPSVGAHWRAWQAEHLHSEQPQHHPGFVWWHTLAHRVIRALAIHSGYSSASVRERVYLEQDASGWDGGVLLYAVQPGGDGTLGGLIALVSRFQEILREAEDYLDNCSNDPFCGEVQPKVQPNSINATGPACYACCLLSETSCECQNRFLDRILLLESLQGRA